MSWRHGNNSVIAIHVSPLSSTSFDTGTVGRLVMSEFSANAAGDSLGAGLLSDDAIVASDTCG